MLERSTVLLLIPHLGGGGAERVMELLARHLSVEKYELHLCLVTQADCAPFDLPAHVAVHALAAGRARYAPLRVLRLIWRLRPRLILSGMAHLNLLVLLLRPLMPRGTRILVRQTGTVASTLRKPAATPAFCGLARMLYRSADQVICQSSPMAEDMCRFLRRGNSTRIVVLSNPVDAVRARCPIDCSANAWNGPGPRLLAIGRLAKEKGFDLLLLAFACLRREFPSAELAILGEGTERAGLEELRDRLRLNQHAMFHGYLADVKTYLSDASLFVLASRQEGMPNVILEAASAGLPIVATPAVGGLAHLIQGKDGVWVAQQVSSDALAVSLRSALLAIRPGQRFAHPWLGDFRLEKAIPAYERVIDDALMMACL
jgi:glycosyltransferase involved in cell wall biosynthesis